MAWMAQRAAHHACAARKHMGPHAVRQAPRCSASMRVLATASTAKPPVKHVLVVGAGVIGMVSALRVLQAFPGVQVTVVAHKLGWNTTSTGAAGIWGPFQLSDTPEDAIKRWAGVTLDHLYDVLYSDEGAKAGLSLRGVHSLLEEAAPPPSWADLTDGFAPLSARKLGLFNRHRTSGPPFAAGWFYHAIACEGGPYLRYLHNKILALGGQVLQTPQPLASLSEVFDPEARAGWHTAPLPITVEERLGPIAGAAPAASSRDGGSIAGLLVSDYLAGGAGGAGSSRGGDTPGVGETSPGALGAAPLGSGRDALAGAPDVDAVVNCTGIGAGALLRDGAVVPIRGHVLRVLAPWVCNTYFNGMTYVIPNNHTVVLGGTAQVGDWNEEPLAEERRLIVQKCVELLPSLVDARILFDWVGLRPGRTSVRLELDALELPGQAGRRIPLVHNYGHGGAGLTLAWGCAEDVVSLLRGA